MLLDSLENHLRRLMCTVRAVGMFLILSGTGEAATVPQIEYQGPVRIAKLLWKANPRNAANTLRNAMNTALDRGDVAGLSRAVEPLKGLAQELLDHGDNVQDERYAVGLSISMLVDVVPRANGERLPLIDVMRQIEQVADQELIWRVWLNVDSQAAVGSFAQLLIDQELNPALRVVVIKRALEVQSSATPILLARWADLPAEVQVAAIEPLTTQREAMSQLVGAIKAGKVNKDLVNTNQLRKWLATDNPELVEQIESVWGRIRTGDNAVRQQLVVDTLQMLRTDVRGSAARGELVFDRVCSQCHQLHGRGYEVGPNITGNGRGSLDQLVSNVLDPSLVIGEAYQARLVLTTDGQVLSGLLVGETERYLKIKVQGGKVIELDKDEDIEQMKTSDKSLMPEGLEEQLMQQEMVDLFAYLSLLKPLGSEGNELIPGTPESLVAP